MTTTPRSARSGPAKPATSAQLKAYDKAWGQFFARLKADGITADNTLFVITADENDHFVGGPPNPSNCDGITIPCTYAQIGELDANVSGLLATQRGDTLPFSVHSDSAPTFYIVGNPGQTDPVTRTLEADVDALMVTSPITGKSDKLSVYLADQAEMNLLHMVTSAADRTPTFTMFGNPDYFNFAGAPNCNAPCVVEEGSSGFAWNHGDFQPDITTTWFGMVGPGVQRIGRDDNVFSDHTDLRPTILALLGLKDDYVVDGRVLIEFLEPHVAPLLNSHNFVALAQVYKQINAPVGPLGLASLKYANASITAKDTTSYPNYLTTIAGITATRNNLAAQMITLLNDAAFAKKPINGAQAHSLISEGNQLLTQVQTLAGP